MPNFRNKEEYEKWKTERLKNIPEKVKELKNSENDVPPVQEDKKKFRYSLKKVLSVSVLFIIVFGSLSYLYDIFYYQPKKVAIDFSGNWTGVGTTENGKTVLFEFTVVQDRETNWIKGNGSIQISGSLVKSYYDVSGSWEGENLHFLFFGSGFVISFDGTAGVSKMTGKLKGSGIEDEYMVFIKK